MQKSISNILGILSTFQSYFAQQQGHPSQHSGRVDKKSILFVGVDTP